MIIIIQRIKESNWNIVSVAIHNCAFVSYPNNSHIYQHPCALLCLYAHLCGFFLPLLFLFSTCWFHEMCNFNWTNNNNNNKYESTYHTFSCVIFSCLCQVIQFCCLYFVAAFIFAICSVSVDVLSFVFLYFVWCLWIFLCFISCMYMLYAFVRHISPSYLSHSRHSHAKVYNCLANMQFISIQKWNQTRKQ